MVRGSEPLATETRSMLPNLKKCSHFISSFPSFRKFPTNLSEGFSDGLGKIRKDLGNDGNSHFVMCKSLVYPPLGLEVPTLEYDI